MTGNDTIMLNGRSAKIGSKENLLEVIRSNGIDMPTFGMVHSSVIENKP